MKGNIIAKIFVAVLIISQHDLCQQEKEDNRESKAFMVCPPLKNLLFHNENMYRPDGLSDYISLCMHFIIDMCRDVKEGKDKSSSELRIACVLSESWKFKVPMAKI
ncbi:MAG: hypothetical protein MHPSP_003282 [Paramarteilia canceri]